LTVVEILELDEVHHVGDVSVQVDLGRGEVHALAEPGEGNGVGVVAAISQPAGHGLPTLEPPSQAPPTNT
jgi:hypothetical protein